jgi:hypothetical protein
MATPPNFTDLVRKQRLAVNSQLSFNSVVNRGSPACQSVAIPVPIRPTSSTVQIIFAASPGDAITVFFNSPPDEYALAEYWDGTTQLESAYLEKVIQPGDTTNPKKITLHACNSQGQIQGVFKYMQIYGLFTDQKTPWIQINASQALVPMGFDLQGTLIANDNILQGRSNYGQLYLGSNMLSAFNFDAFDNLDYLDLSSNALTSIDTALAPNLVTLAASQMTSLLPQNVTLGSSVQSLNVQYNKWTNININSPLQRLTQLLIQSNLLSSLDTNALYNLQELNCLANPLSTIDVTPLTALKIFTCGNTPVLSTVQGVATLPNLQTFNCINCNVSSIVFSNTNSKLKYVDVSANPALKTINIQPLSANLEILYINSASRGIRELDASNMEKLKIFDVNNTSSLTSINVQGCKQLQQLRINSTALSSVNLTGLYNLTQIYAPNAQLRTLDCISLSALNALLCQNNTSLSAVNMVGLSSLINMFANNCNLSAVNVAGMPARFINIDNNKFSTASLDSLFTQLSAVAYGQVFCKNNPGAATCNTAIATAKGYDVYIT